MGSNRPDVRNRLAGYVLLPVADDAALETARRLEPYDPDRVTALHVVEMEGGLPDPLPAEVRAEIGEQAVAAVEEVFPDADRKITSSAEIPDAVFEVAAEVDADWIVFRPREKGRLFRFLTGDRSLELVTGADRPVVTLP